MRFFHGKWGRPKGAKDKVPRKTRSDKGKKQGPYKPSNGKNAKTHLRIRCPICGHAVFPYEVRPGQLEPMAWAVRFGGKAFCEWSPAESDELEKLPEVYVKWLRQAIAELERSYDIEYEPEPSYSSPAKSRSESFFHSDLFHENPIYASARGAFRTKNKLV